MLPPGKSITIVTVFRAIAPKPATVNAAATAESRIPAAPRRVEAVWLGRIGYDRALVLQREAAARAAKGGPETLLLLEHEPVFTLGRNASAADVLFTPERRRELRRYRK